MYTPGPWHIYERPAMFEERSDSPRAWMVFGPADSVRCDWPPKYPGEEWAVAIVDIDIPPWGEETALANARLIAASPLLVSELERAADGLDLAAQVLDELGGPGVPTFRGAAARARAAIAGAVGKPPE